MSVGWRCTARIRLPMDWCVCQPTAILQRLCSSAGQFKRVDAKQAHPERCRCDSQSYAGSQPGSLLARVGAQPSFLPDKGSLAGGWPGWQPEVATPARALPLADGDERQPDKDQRATDQE